MSIQPDSGEVRIVISLVPEEVAVACGVMDEDDPLPKLLTP